MISCGCSHLPQHILKSQIHPHSLWHCEASVHCPSQVYSALRGNMKKWGKKRGQHAVSYRYYRLGAQHKAVIATSFKKPVESPIWRGLFLPPSLVSDCGRPSWHQTVPDAEQPWELAQCFVWAQPQVFCIYIFPKHDLEQMLLDTRTLLQGWNRKITAEEGDME